jgi:hypothetical protein
MNVVNPEKSYEKTKSNHPLDLALEEFEKLTIEKQFEIYIRAGLVNEKNEVTKEYGGEGEPSPTYQRRLIGS